MKKVTGYLFKLLLIQLCMVGVSHAGEIVNESVDLGGNRQATWYIPDNTPSGWILLQHGFQRNKNNLEDIATHLMDNGLMVLTINSSVTRGNPSLARNVADSLVDSTLTPPNGASLPSNMIIAGHSAGGLFVSHMGGRLVERGYANLKGALLFDPVDAGNGMESNLQSMINNGNPVLSILANGSSCNSSNNALPPLRNLTDSFVGIKLTDNSKHTDVEGDSTGGIITFLCGSPDDKNVNYLQEFTLAWAKDMLEGTTSSDYYPGGSKLQQLLADDDAELIKEITTIPPTADFSFAANELSVQFSNSSSDGDGSITSYNWDFGDGNSSSQQSPSHTYNAAGTYTVSLTVTADDGQTGSTNKMVTVAEDTAAPAAGFTYSKNELTVDFTNTSSDSDGSVVSSSWMFGDGSSSNESNPTHTFSQAGSYEVSLEVTDNDGLTDMTTQTISVTGGDPDDGLANGEVVSNLSASRNDELYFTMNVPANARDLQFKINGGSGDADIYIRYNAVPTTSQYDFRPYRNGNNETVDIASPEGGVWHIMIRAYRAFSGLTLTASYATSENQAPTAGFSIAPSGLTVAFSDTSTDVDGTISARLWTFGDGDQSTDANPSHTFPRAGSYNVTLTVTDDDGASGSETKTIEVSTDTDGAVEIFNGSVLNNLSASRNGELQYVLKNLPADTAELRFLIEGGSGDADIYVRYGAAPTTSQYDYRPYRNGNFEPVNISNPDAGNWYVMIRAYRTFSGVTLTADHTVN